MKDRSNSSVASNTMMLVETLSGLISGTATLNSNISKVGGTSVPTVGAVPILPTGIYSATGTLVDVGTLLTSIKNSVDALPSGYTDIIGRNVGGDFVVTFTTATQLTLSVFPTYMPAFVVSMVEEVHQITNGITTVFKRETSRMTYAGGVLTVADALFINTDEFLVFTNMGKLAGSIYSEDTTHTSGAAGSLILSVRNDAHTALAGNGDYIPLMTNGVGDLYTFESNSTAIAASLAKLDLIVSRDDTTVHAVNIYGNNIMAAATPTDTTVDANDIGMLAMSLDRRLHTDSNIQIGNADVDATHPIPISKDASANITTNRIWVTADIDNEVTIKGTVEDDAVVTSDAPVKIGAVVDVAPAAAADNDMVHLITDIYRKLKIAGHDDIQDLIKTEEQAPYWAHRTTVTHTATLTVGAPTNYYYVIPFDTYKLASFVSRFTMGAGSSAVIKVYCTNNPTENIVTITIANWYDVSTGVIGAANLACGAGAITDAVWYIEGQVPMEYYLIEVAYTDAADSTVLINAKLGY